MNEEEDPTVVIQMKRDFDQFVSDATSFNHSHRSRLNFDQNLSIRSSANDSMKSLLDIKRENALKEAEFIRAKSEITKLKSELQSIETSRKRARIEFEKDVSSIKEEKEMFESRMNEMKSQLQFLSQRESKAIEDLKACQHEFKEYKQNKEKKILAILSEKSKLEEELLTTKRSTWEKMSDLKAKNFNLESENSKLQSEVEEAKMQMNLQMNKSMDAASQIKELEEYKIQAKAAEMNIRTLESKISSMEEDHIVARVMKSQLANMPVLEKENNTLKEEILDLRGTVENNLLLKEQAESMRQKLERAERRCEKVGELEAENLDLKTRLNKWETAESKDGPLQNPTQLSKRLAYLQEAEAVMLEKQGQLQSSLSSAEEAKKFLQQKYDQLDSILSSEKIKNQQLSQLVKRLQRKLLLISKERDMYKGILDSYENDVTVNIGATASSRISQLEEVVQGYRKNNEALESELSLTKQKMEQESPLIKPKTVPDKESIKLSEPSVDRSIVLQLRERIATLEKDLEKVVEEKYVLEDRIEQRHLQGDYDPTKLKVLHFTMNPATLAQQERSTELARLRIENKQLVNRVKILEESGAEAMDVTKQVEIKMQEPCTSKEVDEMKQLVAKEELKNKRLVETFRKATQDFREMCYQTIGYKIDKTASNTYKLTSMYAESQDDFFIFEVTPEGDVQFKATDFAETLQDHIDLYISKQNSIPGFLSATTLDLIQRQTMNIS